MEQHSNRNRKAIGIIAIVVVVLAGFAGAWYWFKVKPEQEAKEKARIEQIAKAEAEKKRRAQAAQKKSRYDKLLEDAKVQFDNENWETANSLYTQASSLYPNESFPMDQLAIIKSKLDEIAAIEANRAAGIVETISSSTGRYYILVSSSIDDDLAMDYAGKLAKEGNSVKVIEHFADKLTFFGVSLGDYDTLEKAESAKASFSTFENEVWVMKY